jgi:hypothetical protein
VPVIPARFAHACRQAPLEPGYGKAGIQRPVNLDARRQHSGMTVHQSVREFNGAAIILHPIAALPFSRRAAISCNSSGHDQMCHPSHQPLLQSALQNRSNG